VSTSNLSAAKFLLKTEVTRYALCDLVRQMMHDLVVVGWVHDKFAVR
jgi:hypothetical protein